MLRPWQIHFRIDEREEKTVFLKLTNLISQEILSGRLVQGIMLPGSRSLSKELGINRKRYKQFMKNWRLKVGL